NGSRDFESNNAYFGTELSLEIDSLNLISGQFGFNNGNFINNSLSHSVLTGNTGVMQAYDIINTSEYLRDGWDGSLNYQLGFKSNKNRFLTFSYRYYTYGDEQESNLTASQRINYTIPDFRQFN